MNKILYHASLKKMKILQPISIDIGNKKEKMGWSLFCFDNRDYSIGYLILLVINKIYKDKKMNGEKDNDLKCYWYLPLNRPVLTENGLNKIKTYLNSHKIYGYIYKIEKPIEKIGLGNDVALPEFTIREKNIKYTNIEKIEINSDLLNNYVHILNKNEFENYLKDIEKGNFNKYKRKEADIMFSYKEKMNMKNIIRDALKNNNITIDDDLNEIYKKIVDNNLDERSIIHENNNMEEYTNKLTMNERNKLNKSDFGIPEIRKYPLHDKQHVISAIRYFDKCEPKYKIILANNIINKIKKYGITLSTDSALYKFLKKKDNYKDLI